MYKEQDYILTNGVKIPKIGFGTWQTPDGDVAYNSVRCALDAGYRHIDTAFVYGNEASVGKAVKDSKISREKLFITTKLPSEVKDFDGALKHFELSLKNLDCGYIDLYLIHAPWPWSDVGRDCTEGNIQAWKAMIKLYEEGRVRAIGVSNFHPADIENIKNATGVTPMANQIRYFIGNTQPAVSGYCRENGILVQAYSPLATGELLDNSYLTSLAERYNKPISKICLAYCLQTGANPLPKSTHKERIIDNLDVDFLLSDEDMKYLGDLHHIASTRKFRD